MKKRNIGGTDLNVAPINLGGNVFGWTLNEAESFKILDAFVDKGYNFIDTADIYSFWVNGGVGGQSEEIIGNWMKSRGNREDIILATKVGGADQVHGLDTSRKHILKSVDESLQRLKTDYIDLYYTHFDDEVTPVEETLSTYDELIKAGKVRYIGASNISPARLEESFAVSEKNNLAKYVALQPHYNLVERQKYESEYAPLAEKYNLSVFTYWSLASGFLTGKYRTEDDLQKSARGNDVAKYLNESGKSVLASLDAIAEKHKSSPAAVSLAWLLAQPHITAPIASATSESQLNTLFEATELKLDSEDLARF